MAEDKRNYSNHKIIIDERENVTINGVNEVLSFDEESIVCVSNLGVIVVRGENLHISRLDLDAEVLCAEGRVDSVTYEEEFAVKGGFFNRIFR
ncbi:sporulation protein YabP [Lachnospiraceae bacterium NSJ-143]|nr:sporulation protein YabP [Lachnospiraceae bacterium NSJ-143]